MLPFSWEAFAETADQSTARFVERTESMTEWIDSSILFSDGFCVCALCDFFAVDCLVEAGTGFGGSTEMFARYFQDSPRLRGIWSVDDAVSPRWQWPLAKLGLRHYSRFVWSTEKRAKHIARERLAPFSNVTLVRGDAHVKVPKIIRDQVTPDTRVGVVIDGPKGEEQLRLAETLLERFPGIAFIALDDIGPIFDVEQRGERFRASPHAAFATSDRQFFDRYGWINRGRLPPRMIGDATHTGYGMGILIPQ
jgi:hypothetical protein